MFLEIRFVSFIHYLIKYWVNYFIFSQAVTDAAGIDRESSMCMALP